MSRKRKNRNKQASSTVAPAQLTEESPAVVEVVEEEGSENISLEELFEIAREGQVACKEYLSTFVSEQKLTADWESLLFRLVPRVSEVTSEEVIEKGWDNLLKVIDIIKEQGISDDLKKRFSSLAPEESTVPAVPRATSLPDDMSAMIPCRGLDVGTVNIVGSYCSKIGSEHHHYNIQRNAFMQVSADDFTRDMLDKLELDVLSIEDKDYVIGDGAFRLANIFQTNTRRPMSDGLISTEEDEAQRIIEQIFINTIGRATNNEPCVFTVPANPIDSDRNNVYHTGAIGIILKRLGYNAQKIDEGHSVIFSELAERDYTGIGISCGGGMSNVCISFRSVPASSFSVSRGGDWIDNNVSTSLDMPVSHVAAAKEEGFDMRNPKGRVEEALTIYYNEFISYTLEKIQREVTTKGNMPIFSDPVDIVLCGGTSMVSGFVEAFENQIARIQWPIEIAQVRMAEDPLRTVSSGCLKAAIEYMAGQADDSNFLI